MWTPESVEAASIQIATKHNLDAKLFRDVVSCESTFNHEAVGDGGYSHGAVQIHLPSHPDVSIEEARDPLFALNWMADRWEEGNADMWTCYRLLTKGS